MIEPVTPRLRAFVYCRKPQESDERQVLSLEGQRMETARKFQASPTLEITEQFEEAQTAKKPGRPLFAAMLRRIEAGEADTTIAWDPDRLSRNSRDSGEIIYLLDRRLLKDLKFVTWTFENNPHGKWMLSMLLANAKLHTDKMSEGLNRTYRTKVANGWYPVGPPLGYQTDRATRTIVKDPTLFPGIRRIWDLMLTGAYTPRHVLERASNEWGLRTRRRRRTGGKPMCLSHVYYLLNNPFYAGSFRWKGTLVQGKHPAMVTWHEFDRVQEILGRPGRPRPKERLFAYAGLCKCGACGLSITAETKRHSRSGYVYTYYHCTRRKLGVICRQPVMPLVLLEEQIHQFLREITIPEQYARWALEEMRRSQDANAQAIATQRRSLELGVEINRRKYANLRGLRVADQITETEFLQDNEAMDREYQRLSQSLGAMTSAAAMIELEETVIAFSAEAASAFPRLKPLKRRTLLEVVGSNHSIKDRKLTIGAAPPFRRWRKVGVFPQGCPWLEDVRTFVRDPSNADRIAKMNTLLKVIRAAKPAA